jgi:hypothetical protein
VLRRRNVNGGRALVVTIFCGLENAGCVLGGLLNLFCGLFREQPLSLKVTASGFLGGLS